MQRATTQDARAENGKSGTTTAIFGKRRRVRRIYRQTTLRRAFVCYELTRKTMMTAIKWGLVAFVLFTAAYIFEYRAILALESSDSWPQVYGYAP